MYYLVKRPEGTVIYKTPEHMTIPLSESNSDYRAYAEWLAEGNTPEPWPPAE